MKIENQSAPSINQQTARHCQTRICQILVFLGLLIPTVNVQAQRNLKDIPIPDPALELKSFQVADGFEVNLYASDPLIAKPIHMNFDSDGRLWIASSEVYPHIKPGQAANDKLVVLEDRDGDGTAEITRVFADGLLIPTGVEPGNGGVYVANSTELLHLRDTNGDGKADQQRVVLSGFGTEDTHHILHTLRWGPAGHLYFNQSIYIHSHIETPYGVKRLNGGGIWQFRPETLELNVYARGLVNPWGHQLDAFGQSLATDGAGGEGINYIVPQAAYFTAVGVPRILRGLNPGSPKYCGLEICSGRHLPDDWQGCVLTNDFRGHRVCRFTLTDNGAGFTSRQEVELIKTKHVAFRPIDIKMGPDGAIYIADWYNPIIQHGEVDFRDARRDHTHGRIWRVTYRGRPLVQRQKLSKLSSPALLELLKSPEGWTRHHAKRVLSERAEPEIDTQLVAWLRGLDAQSPKYEQHMLEGVWLCQSRRNPQPALLLQLLQAQDPRVRAAATRIIGPWWHTLPDAMGLLTRQIRDEHPRVRLEAIRVLGTRDELRAVQVALGALDSKTDRFLDYALWLTCRELQPRWLPELRAGRLTFGGQSRHLAFAVKAAGSQDIVKPLIEMVRADQVEDRVVTDILQVICSLGQPNDLRMVFELATAAASPQMRKRTVLGSLNRAAMEHGRRPSGKLDAVAQFLDSEDPLLRKLATQLIGRWKLAQFSGNLTAMALSQTETEQQRQTAITALSAIRGEAALNAVGQLTSPEQPRTIRLSAAIALSTARLKPAAAAAVRLLSQNLSAAETTRLIMAFVEQRGGPQALAAALRQKTIRGDNAKIALRAVSAAGRKEDKLHAALIAAGSVSAKPAALTAEEMSRFVSNVQQHGDPDTGEAIFRRRDLNCLNCHAISGAGGKVGPDLASVGASAQIDYLTDALLLPNKAVKENFHTLVVATDQGKLLTGIKVGQTDTHLVLRNAEDREILIPLKSIEEQAPGSSIMPGGLTEKLTREEMVHLVRFLSELGKIGRFGVNRQRLVRRWRVLQSTQQANFRLRRTSYDAITEDHPSFVWQPAYSTVSGELPLGNLPELRIRNRSAGRRGVSFVHCDLSVTQPGPIQLALGSVEGLSLWVGSRPVKLADRITLSVAPGTQRLTFAVDLNRRQESLRVELVDVPNSPARAEITGGK